MLHTISEGNDGIQFYPMAPIGICRMLDEMGILTPGGKMHWRESTILSILSNEKLPPVFIL